MTKQIGAMLATTALASAVLAGGMARAQDDADGAVLPFPPTPSASVAGPTLQESIHQRRASPSACRRMRPTS